MKIKSFLLSLSCLVFLASCNKENKTEKADYVLFSGTVKNLTGNTIEIYGSGGIKFKQIIDIKEDGTFSDTLKIDTKGTYTYMLDSSVKGQREQASIYLDQGDQLDLSIDINEFDESIKYTGTAANPNNYIAESFLLDERFLPEDEGYKNLYSKEPQVFKDEALKHTQEKNELLKKHKDIDSAFLSTNIKANHYDYLAMLNNFEDYHEYYTKKTGYRAPEGFYNELKDLDMDNSKAFESSRAYNQLVQSFYTRISRDKAYTDSISIDKAQIESLSKFESKNIKDALFKSLASQVSSTNENVEELYNMMLAISDDKRFSGMLTKRFESIKKLMKGNESPAFNDYENFAGGTTSLKDLKGKYVYIDIWATWCGPCKAEIPHLKKIEKEFHNKNIEFVSISIDKKDKYDAWKKIITEKELGGIQLLADKDWASQFIADYNISGIPRFILIDPNGKIVNSDAPRPSDSELLDVFKELNI